MEAAGADREADAAAAGAEISRRAAAAAGTDAASEAGAAAEEETDFLAPSAVEEDIREPGEVAAAAEVESKRLYWAARDGDAEALRRALAQGGLADGHRDHDGWTALAWASYSGKLECVRVLLAAGADVTVRDRPLGATALHLAARWGHDKVIRELLDAGADIDSQDDVLHTTLHVAVARGHSRAVRVLCEAGSDVNAQNIAGETPLHRAVFHNRQYVAPILLMHSADPNIQTANGRTPLHMACTMFHNNVALMICEAGGDPTIEDNDGLSPRMAATHAGNIELINYFGNTADEILRSRSTRARNGASAVGGSRSELRRGMARQVLMGGLPCVVAHAKLPKPKERMMRLGTDDRTISLFKRNRLTRRMVRDRALVAILLTDEATVTVVPDFAAVAPALAEHCTTAPTSTIVQVPGVDGAGAKGKGDLAGAGERTAPDAAIAKDPTGTGGAAGSGAVEKSVVDKSARVMETTSGLGGTLAEATALATAAAPDGVPDLATGVLVVQGSTAVLIGPLERRLDDVEAADFVELLRTAIGGVAAMYPTRCAVEDAMAAWAAYNTHVARAGGTDAAASHANRTLFHRANAEDHRASRLLRDKRTLFQASIRQFEQSRDNCIRIGDADNASAWEVRAETARRQVMSLRSLAASLAGVRPRHRHRLAAASASASETTPLSSEATAAIGADAVVIRDATSVADAFNDEEESDGDVEEGTQCIVCMERRMSVILRPCNHQCTCERCAAELMAVTARFGGRCPLCREPIAEIERVS